MVFRENQNNLESKNELKKLLAEAPADFLFQAQNVLEGQGYLEIEKSCCNVEFSFTKEKISFVESYRSGKTSSRNLLFNRMKYYWYNLLDKSLKNYFALCHAKNH